MTSSSGNHIKEFVLSPPELWRAPEGYGAPSVGLDHLEKSGCRLVDRQNRDGGGGGGQELCCECRRAPSRLLLAVTCWGAEA